MSSLCNVFNVWTDGSYNNTHHVGGAGWLIRHADGSESEGCKPLSHFPSDAKAHGSDAAEIFAVGNALGNIPKGSTVKLRLDAQNVIDWFTAGKITSKNKADVRFLRRIFSLAMEQVNVMKSVEFIKVGGNSNEDLGRAHELSRRGRSLAMPKLEKKRRSVKTSKPQRKRGFSPHR